MVWDEYANLVGISGAACLEQPQCRSLRGHPGALLKLQRRSRGVGHEGAAGETLYRLNARPASLPGVLLASKTAPEKKGALVICFRKKILSLGLMCVLAQQGSRDSGLPENTNDTSKQARIEPAARGIGMAQTGFVSTHHV
ncbi:hypothetical protein CRENBAI_009762 [Crenichthys baileyi]|uniref:Uncharacterized protein n=1 Tax=Crenichthys baileyi TaxID=28760 RepID=A0AAV9RMN1_9TELE